MSVKVRRGTPMEALGDHETRIRRLERSLNVLISTPYGPYGSDGTDMETVVVAEPCLLSDWAPSNASDEFAWLKIYDRAAGGIDPDVDVPVRTFGIPPYMAANFQCAVDLLNGLVFRVTLSPDNDATDTVPAGLVVINLGVT